MPTQRACAYYFLVVGLLFPIQTWWARPVRPTAPIRPVSSGSTWAAGHPITWSATHVWLELGPHACLWLAIFWTATSFLAAGLFEHHVIPDPEFDHVEEPWQLHGTPALGGRDVLDFPDRSVQ